MSESIRYSNTPIFDQLARERSYDRLIAGGPINLRPAFTGVKTKHNGYTPAGFILDEVQGVQTDDAVDAAQTSDSIGEDTPASLVMVPDAWKVDDEE